MTPRPLHDIAPALDPVRELTSAAVTHAVSPETARVLLTLEPVGRLVVTDAGGSPVVLPVNHRLERDGSLLLRTAGGTKLRVARRGGADAAFEVDRVDPDGRGWVVVASGPLEEVLDQTKAAAAARSGGVAPYADDMRRERWLRLAPRLLRAYRLGATDGEDTLDDARRHDDGLPRDRGELEILDLDTCYRLLRGTPVGRIAYVDAGEPLILPVNHAVDGRRIVFRSAPGSKAEAADRSRPVAFEVDGYDPSERTGWSVLVRGVLEVVWEDADHERIRALLSPPWADGIERERILAITPSEVTGRRIARDRPVEP